MAISFLKTVSRDENKETAIDDHNNYLVILLERLEDFILNHIFELKRKDEILTPLDTEGGREGEEYWERRRGEGARVREKRRRKRFRMTIKDTLPAVKTAPFEQGEELFDLFPIEGDTEVCPFL